MPVVEGIENDRVDVAGTEALGSFQKLRRLVEPTVRIPPARLEVIRPRTANEWKVEPAEIVRPDDLLERAG
jgi:hypothetical protein